MSIAFLILLDLLWSIYHELWHAYYLIHNDLERNSKRKHIDRRTLLATQMENFQFDCAFVSRKEKTGIGMRREWCEPF